MENKSNGKVANRIVQLRRERGLSQAELSEILYIDRRTIGNAEQGIGTLSNFIAIADFFGVTVDYILKRSNERNNVFDGLGEIDLQILDHLKTITEAEKERLLKHLQLEKSLKNIIGK